MLKDERELPNEMAKLFILLVEVFKDRVELLFVIPNFIDDFLPARATHTFNTTHCAREPTAMVVIAIRVTRIRAFSEEVKGALLYEPVSKVVLLA